ncbi:hypothetical protein [uncultured Microscilla sp.]|uniref:hypothetical protein n=1 Tax=uncultured Microscilla sp. TaxID=432653 RepID=UPI0026257FBB|nr:hypothetical protein [uncultured Microscilla sp.]
MRSSRKVTGLPSRYSKVILARLEKKGVYVTLQIIRNVVSGRTSNLDVEIEVLQLKKERLEARDKILQLSFEIRELNDCVTKKEKEKPT